MAGPGDNQATEGKPVEVKLADYGISRLAMPTGMKGFGGTEGKSNNHFLQNRSPIFSNFHFKISLSGFMAPEIMRFNGEEEYTDKVMK